MFRVLGIIGVLTVACLSISGSEAEDRDEFYAIARGDAGRVHRTFSFGAWWNRTPAQPVRHVAAAAPSRPRVTRAPSRQQQQVAVATADRSQQAYCVRTCDGYFFPIGAAARGDARQSQAAACEAMCPGAPTRLYSSREGSIDTARTEGGQLYAATATAFRYRERLVPGCSCQGSVTAGLARLALARDHTLREGDVVVTDAGVRVFQGAARFPYQPRDFVTAQAYGRLPVEMRRRVREIEQASVRHRLRVASVEPGAARDIFDRAARLDPVREMIGGRREVRDIPIVTAMAPMAAPEPLPRPREAPSR